MRRFRTVFENKFSEQLQMVFTNNSRYTYKYSSYCSSTNSFIKNYIVSRIELSFEFLSNFSHFDLEDMHHAIHGCKLYCSITPFNIAKLFLINLLVLSFIQISCTTGIFFQQHYKNRVFVNEKKGMLYILTLKVHRKKILRILHVVECTKYSYPMIFLLIFNGYLIIVHQRILHAHRQILQITIKMAMRMNSSPSILFLHVVFFSLQIKCSRLTMI